MSTEAEKPQVPRGSRGGGSAFSLRPIWVLGDSPLPGLGHRVGGRPENRCCEPGPPPAPGKGPE